MAELDIITRLLLDQASKATMDKGVQDSAEKLKTLGGAFPGDELAADVDLFQQAFNKTFKRVGDDLIDLRTGLKTSEAAMRDFSKSSVVELAKVVGANEAVKDSNKDMAKSAAAAASAQAAIFSAQASLLNNQVLQMRARASELTRISNVLGGLSRGGLVIGGAVVGGIFGLANKYVQDAEQATAVTREWKAAQDSLNKSGERFGAVLAQEALPLLKIAADVAQKASAFVEQHPEIVAASLNAGLVLAGLSAVGIAVSKGIKFYADQLYLASVPVQLQAAKLQALAAEQQLTAATLRAESKGIDVATKGGGITGKLTGLGLLTTTGGIALLGTTIAVGLGAAIGAGVNDLIVKFTGRGATTNQFATVGAQSLGRNIFSPLAQKFGGVSAEEAERKTLVFTAIVGRLTGAIDENSNLWLRAAGKVNKAGNEINGVKPASSSTVTSDELSKALAVYEKYAQDDLQLTQDHYRERDKIISDALADEQAAARKYADSVRQVNAQRTSALAENSRNFVAENKKAEADNNRQRAEIVRDGGIEIEKIEADLQERLRKLNLDHADRVDDLTRSRDALGLAKEQRAFNRARGEEVRQANQEIRQRRQDIAQRLQDLQSSYEAERNQRLVDYQARVVEIQAESRARLTELRIQHENELKEIRQSRIDKLKELDAQLADERKRRLQGFLQNIKDIDANLLNERILRQRFNAEMIAAADQMIATIRGRLASLRGTGQSGANASTFVTPGQFYGTRASGGYAGYGTYLLGDAPGGGRGKREFVMAGQTTEIAERAMGGQLSQERLISALMFAGGGGSQSSMQYTDNRRMDSRIGPVERKLLLEDTIKAMSQVFGKGNRR